MIWWAWFTAAEVLETVRTTRTSTPGGEREQPWLRRKHGPKGVKSWIWKSLLSLGIEKPVGSDTKLWSGFRKKMGSKNYLVLTTIFPRGCAKRNRSCTDRTGFAKVL